MKKFTPLLILLIFLIGVVWMVLGMKNAMDITSHKKGAYNGLSGHLCRFKSDS